LLTAPEVTVWTTPAKADLAERLLDVMGGSVRPLGVGGPRSTEIDRLAKRWDCPAGNDLRKLLIDRPAAYLLMMSLDGVRAADLQAAARAGTRVLCLEPWAVERSELDAAATPGQPDALGFAPAFLQSPGCLAAADPQDQLGHPRLVRFVSHGRADEGSLLARLIDGWLSVLSFNDLPESIDATLHHAGPGGSRAAEPRDLSGWLTAHARLADGSAVLFEASDRAASPRRHLLTLGPDAQLRITDGRYQLQNSEENLIDAGGEDKNHPPYIDLVARQWRQWIERPAPVVPPSRRARALACVHASLLSARTGSPESPTKLMKIGRP
jgi:hypothetical protein